MNDKIPVQGKVCKVALILSSLIASLNKTTVSTKFSDFHKMGVNVLRQSSQRSMTETKNRKKVQKRTPKRWNGEAYLQYYNFHLQY